MAINNRIEFNRPSWVEYYIGLAFIISQRSHDAQTKHGCIITDRNHRILGVGYNGFPRGVDDSTLPNVRPPLDISQNHPIYKYPWMYHSETNALANCILRPDNGVAYVTGQCCNNCIYSLWQNGITEVFMADKHGTALRNIHDVNWFNLFVEKTGIIIHKVKPDLSWLKTITENLSSSSFWN